MCANLATFPEAKAKTLTGQVILTLETFSCRDLFIPINMEKGPMFKS